MEIDVQEKHTDDDYHHERLDWSFVDKGKSSFRDTLL